jgi:hypothetical protein
MPLVKCGRCHTSGPALYPQCDCRRVFKQTIRNLKRLSSSQAQEITQLKARVVELRSALGDALECIDQAVSDKHSPWCNDVHEAGCCEGDYLMGPFMKHLRDRYEGKK